MADEAGVGVNVFATWAQLKEGMAGAVATVEESTAAMAGAFESMAGAIEGALAPLIAITLAFEALHILTSTIEHVADLAVELDVLRNKTGMNVEELSALRYAADLSHVSLEQLSLGIQRLARNIEQAAKGGHGPAADALRALGLSATDATGAMRPMNDLLLDIAERFKTMPDGTEKTALAMDLFGRSGAALIPLLDRGRDGIRELEAEAKKLGITMSDEDETSALRFHEAMRQLSAVWNAFIRDIVVSGLPVLTRLVQTMQALVHAVQAAWFAFKGISLMMSGELAAGAAALTESYAALEKVMSAFSTTPTPLSSTTGEGAPIIPHGAPSELELFREEWNKIKEAAIARNEDILPLEIAFWKDKLATVKEGTKEYIEIHTHLVDLEEQLAKHSKEEQKKAAHETQQEWTKAFEALPKAFHSAVQQMRGHAQSFHDFMSDLLRSLTLESIAASIKMLEVHAATELAKKHITVSSVLESAAIHTWAAIKWVIEEAAMAAASAWAAIASIPGAGPFLAPAVALATLGGVLALLGTIHSAASGYDVPAGMNPVTQLHAQEMVLPREYADVIRGIAKGGHEPQGSGGVTIIYAMDAQDVERVLMRNPNAVAKAATKGYGNGVSPSTAPGRRG